MKRVCVKRAVVVIGISFTPFILFSRGKLVETSYFSEESCVASPFQRVFDMGAHVRGYLEALQDYGLFKDDQVLLCDALIGRIVQLRFAVEQYAREYRNGNVAVIDNVRALLKMFDDIETMCKTLDSVVPLDDAICVVLKQSKGKLNGLLNRHRLITLAQ